MGHNHKKTLIFVSRQAGTARAFAPLIREIEADGSFNIISMSFPLATKIFDEEGITSHNIRSFEEALPLLEAIQNPAHLITGTSLSVDEDYKFWQWADDKHIPSLGFVDSWVNYWQRFTSSGRNSKRFDRVPTRIGVIDELAEKRMIESGADKNWVLVVGHPGFEEICARYEQSSDRIQTIRKDLLQKEFDYFVLFVSEPISVIYGESKNDDGYLGYTEKEVLEKTIKALDEIGNRLNKTFLLSVKLHPREEAIKKPAILNAVRSTPHVRTNIANLDKYDGVFSADVIVGMRSILLYEASLLGKEVISFQPNSEDYSDVVNHKNIKTTDRKNDFINALSGIMLNDKQPSEVHKINNSFKECIINAQMES